MALVPLTRPTTLVHVGSLNPIQQFGQKLGLSQWVSQEVSPALRLQVRKGFEVNVENVGTKDAPAWRITPKVPSTTATHSEPTMKLTPVSSPSNMVPVKPKVGVLPLLVPLVKPLTKAVREETSRRQGEIAADPWDSKSQPDQPTQSAGLVGPSRPWGDIAIGLSRDGVGAMLQSPHLTDPNMVIDTDGITRRCR